MLKPQSNLFHPLLKHLLLNYQNISPNQYAIQLIITENFAGDSIYEWDIDGRSDHEIFVTLKRMLIACTAYSTKRATDLQAFDLLTSGFTGILKNWWENYIQEEERDKIRTHTNSQGQLDNIEILIYTIVTNFLDSLKDVQP